MVAKTSSIDQYHKTTDKEFSRLSERYYLLKSDFNLGNKVL
jgi:hypothetical protein